MTTRRICVVTGTRAEYGLMVNIMNRLKKSPHYELQVIAFASHIPCIYGETIKVIQNDGFEIKSKVDMLLASNSKLGVAKSIGVGMIGLADAFDRLTPDLVVYLGDRFEGLCVANCCLVQQIPLAHIFGGDITEGSIDDSVRHAISKAANLHFPASIESANRLIRMGENPKCVHMCGHPGLECFSDPQYFLSRSDLSDYLKISLPTHFIVCIFHPETAFEPQHSCRVLNSLLSALDAVLNQHTEDMKIVFIGSNADANSEKLIEIVKSFMNKRDDCEYFINMPRRQFVSLVKLSQCICGNSSAGLLEVPALKVPTVNVGFRQNGRTGLQSTINVGTDGNSIKCGILQALTLDRSSINSYFAVRETSLEIVNVLDKTPDFTKLLNKIFHE